MVFCLLTASCSDIIPESHINDYCETVYNGFKEEKTEDIKALFCNKSRNDHDLEEELSQAFNYIDGNITLYERFSESSGGKSYRKGELVKYDQTASITGIVTDTGHIYRIAINSLNVYPDDSEIVGVQRIYIREFDIDDENKEIGSFSVGEQYDAPIEY